MDLELRDRVAIVVGGSSGIGRATVRLLLAEGAAVATCGRDPERLAVIAADLQSDGRLLTVSADATNAAAMARLVADTVARFGRLDAVAALAGEGIHGHAFDLSAADWQREFSNKLTCVLNVVRAARPHLADSDAGRIVTVTAPSARDPDPSMAAVSAARAAIANLTRTLALELAAEGTAVNAVAVGLIDTDRQRRRHEHAPTGQLYAEWLRAEAERRRVPFGRAGMPDEVARLIVFALSPALSYTSGAVFDVSGGIAGP